MGDNRFTYKNGIIYDHESKGDVSLPYDLNNDDGRTDLLDFMNDRECMIEQLNDEISRLQDIIADYGAEFRNYAHKKRKLDKVVLLQKELIETYSELSKVVNSEL